MSKELNRLYPYMGWGCLQALCVHMLANADVMYNLGLDLCSNLCVILPSRLLLAGRFKNILIGTLL